MIIPTCCSPLLSCFLPEFVKKHHFVCEQMEHWPRTMRSELQYAPLHKMHKRAATIYSILALFHVTGHFVRWFIRQETMHRTNTQVGISGVISIFTMIIVVFSMSSFAKPIATFETRINAHYLMILFVGALSFHTTRCRYLTLIFL